MLDAGSETDGDDEGSEVEEDEEEEQASEDEEEDEGSEDEEEEQGSEEEEEEEGSEEEDEEEQGSEEGEDEEGSEEEGEEDEGSEEEFEAAERDAARVAGMSKRHSEGAEMDAVAETVREGGIPRGGMRARMVDESESESETEAEAESEAEAEEEDEWLSPQVLPNPSAVEMGLAATLAKLAGSPSAGRVLRESLGMPLARGSRAVRHLGTFRGGAGAAYAAISLCFDTLSRELRGRMESLLAAESVIRGLSRWMQGAEEAGTPGYVFLGRELASHRRSAALTPLVAVLFISDAELAGVALLDARPRRCAPCKTPSAAPVVFALPEALLSPAVVCCGMAAARRGYDAIEVRVSLGAIGLLHNLGFRGSGEEGAEEEVEEEEAEEEEEEEAAPEEQEDYTRSLAKLRALAVRDTRDVAEMAEEEDEAKEALRKLASPGTEFTLRYAL